MRQFVSSPQAFHKGLFSGSAVASDKSNAIVKDRS